MLPRALKPVATAVLLGTLAACATNPATGQREFSLMSEAQEIEIGKQMDGEIRREMGVYDDPDLQRYVEGVGMRLARGSERPTLPWHFAVVDEPAINAFALPGGYIYLTRGILPFLDNEAQLAGVLGHEIGHVTARHSAQQYTKATTAGIGVTLLSIFVPEARPFQSITETALGVMFMKYGRDDELEADRLGVEYTAEGGWNPAGVGGMLRTLARLDEANGSRRGVPNWLSTHPAPADRVEKVQAYVAKTGR
ncbi:MAG: M48 family metalloprotease, partial [Tepidisphaeraceae bacterium]